jgi:DNA-binding SARP family transcriptional activator
VMELRFRVLGPVEVTADGRVLDLGRPKQRAVLAALLMRAGEVVPVDRLVDDLWNGRPPQAVVGSLHAYVANLRRILEPARPARAQPTVLLTSGPGYLLRAENLDATAFARLAGRALAAGRPRDAATCAAAALAQWRGPAFADLAGLAFAEPEIARLDELRSSVREVAARAELARGRHAEAIPDLVRLVADSPLRETPRELLMLALYRCGRQADALALAAETRRLLAAELGIDPGPRLRRLHAAILRQDQGLSWRPVVRAGRRAVRAEPGCVRRRIRRAGAGVRPASHGRNSR